MKNQFDLQIVEGSSECKIIQLRRNGDGKLTKIQAYKGLFGGLRKFKRGREHDWASFFLLYDLKTGLCWWQYMAIGDDYIYTNHAKRDIDTHLSELGYWKEENGIYIYYNTFRNLKQVIYWKEKKIVDFKFSNRSLSIVELKKQYNTFQNAYKQFFLEKIVEEIPFDKKISVERYKNIHISNYIDIRFFQIPNCSMSPVLGEIKNVKRLHSQWLIELIGVDWGEMTRTRTNRDIYTLKDWLVEWNKGYHKTQFTIVLNDHYEIVELFGEDLFIKQSNPLYLSFNNERYEILQFIYQGYTVQEIAHNLGKDNKTISQLIRQMLEEGLVEKIGYGKYKLIGCGSFE